MNRIKELVSKTVANRNFWYRFFLIYGLIGFIFLVFSIMGVNDLSINIGGFLVYLFGPKISGVVAVLMISLSFWWFWLIIAWAIKRTSPEIKKENGEMTKT